MPHKDPEKRRAYLHEYDAKRSEKTRLRKAKWREDNPERHRANMARWHAKNPEKSRAIRVRGRKKLRREVFEHYGDKCACCGEWRDMLLTIDHVDGTGAQHRKSIGGSGLVFYAWLRKNGFPPGFQTLCWSCNAGRYLNGGICPHVTEPTDKYGDH